MNIHQIQNRHRHNRVLNVLTENRAIVDERPAFGEDTDLYAATLADVKRQAQTQALGSQSKTEAKRAARAELADWTMEIAGSVAAYADAIEDVELEELARVRRSDLIHGRAALAPLTATRILNAANSVPADQVAAYELSETVLNEFAERIDAFELILDAPAVAIDERALATDAIEDGLAVADRILSKRLNRHMLRFRRTHPEFAAAYDQAKALEDRRGRLTGSNTGSTREGTTVEVGTTTAVEEPADVENGVELKAE